MGFTSCVQNYSDLYIRSGLHTGLRKNMTIALNSTGRPNNRRLLEYPTINPCKNTYCNWRLPDNVIK